mmetsp:Transcript_55567/g.116269  ORF Transcript_55567/g.116269 Transcript_55567/m.116269 type:complete len:171 (-) Transcript_55567:944-1456(-)
MDGYQVSDFYWIDPIEAAKRFISKPKFAGKLYTKNKRQDSVRRPGKRSFGRANSGLVFQSAQFIDPFSSPLLLLFYADKTFSGKHRSHHPIYMSVLNLHEDERQKPENWIPIGWMPNYDKDLAKRPGQGYESNQARKVRLFHDCFRHLLSNWDNQTKSTHNIVWGDQVRR